MENKWLVVKPRIKSKEYGFYNDIMIITSVHFEKNHQLPNRKEFYLQKDL